MNQIETMANDSTSRQSRLSIHATVDLQRYPIDKDAFCGQCKEKLDDKGVLVLPGFLTPEAVAQIAEEGEMSRDKAFFTNSQHNVYLKPAEPELSADHPRNRLVSSSKGCITTDQIPDDSMLCTLYGNEAFKTFLCKVLDEQSLYEYADPLSSINLHYAAAGQELGWHFDNSSFAITLLIQKPEAGAMFEYVKDIRNADRGEMNYEQVGKVLDGQVPVDTLSMDAGALVLFRGKNSMHRVTPTKGNITRMLVVLAYNSKPDISLSESARMTFYGRLE